jgi:hypothetical protein
LTRLCKRRVPRLYKGHQPSAAIRYHGKSMDLLRIPFKKMNGLGNDFVVIDARPQPVRLPPALAEQIASREAGAGCDQLIILEPSTRSDVFMR